MIADKSITESGRSKVVEYFGLPGAGKSYLAGRLCADLMSGDLRVGSNAVRLGRSGSIMRIMGKLGLILSESWRNRSANQLSWHLMKLYKPLGYRAGIKLFFNWLFICALIRSEARCSDIIVLDQGIGQALWSTNFHGCSVPGNEAAAALFVNLIRDLPISRLDILHVNADDELIRNRILGRVNGKSPLDLNPALWARAVEVTDITRRLLDRVTLMCDFIAVSDISNNGQDSGPAPHHILHADNPV